MVVTAPFAMKEALTLACMCTSCHLMPMADFASVYSPEMFVPDLHLLCGLR